MADMKVLKQIGNIQFYVSEESQKIYAIIQELCKGLEKYVSNVYCYKDVGAIEFKYSPNINCYSVRCDFCKHCVLGWNIHNPISFKNFTGIPHLDLQNYQKSIAEKREVTILYNKVHANASHVFNQLIPNKKI